MIANLAGRATATTLAAALLIAGSVLFASVALRLRERSDSGRVGRGGFVFLGWSFLLSAAVLAAGHSGDLRWVGRLGSARGGDGLLWQVQATFLSVGFAGLAIAAQLFAEAPLAIGASRGRVLEHVWAGWFTAVGLVANAVIGIEAIWLQSDAGVLFVAAFWFLPTMALLVISYGRLMRLFGSPSHLDEVVRTSLVQTLALRLDKVSRVYVGARRQLDDLFAAQREVEDLGSSAATLPVPVPRSGLVVKAIKPQAVRRAVASLAPPVTARGDSGSEPGDRYMPSHITLNLEPGDRTRLGDTAFLVRTAQELDEAKKSTVVQLLQASIEFAPPGSVTPDEETDREIDNLKDAVGTSLRSGAFSTAERALELLGQVVRGVWTARPEILDSSHRSSFTRRDWLFRSVGEAEQDALLSPRAAGLFVTQAMKRALEARHVGSAEYADESLRSFTRLWIDILRHGGSEFESLPPRIVTCVQNLASFGFATVAQQESLQARAIWTMVDLVKLAIDAKKLEAAKLAAIELDGLVAYSGRQGSGRAHALGGQLVLLGWLNYLASKEDVRDPKDPELRALVTPRGKWSEIVDARRLTDRGTVPFSRWEYWEMRDAGSARAQVLELSHYIDRAEVEALAASYGRLPDPSDQETASAYERFLRLLDEGGRDISDRETNLKEHLTKAISAWDATENVRLREEPLSQAKIEILRASLADELRSSPRLAVQIPTQTDVPSHGSHERPILGINYRVPRHYLVDGIFNQTYADPKEVGRVIARSFVDGEDLRIVEALQARQEQWMALTAAAIGHQIEVLGAEAEHYVLAVPYGGLVDDVWYASDFQQIRDRVTLVETGALDEEVLLFDRRAAVISSRAPEEKDGLVQVGDTSIALGVFEDVEGSEEPEVRVEAGEFFVVWSVEEPRIHRFAAPEAADESQA